MSISGNDGSYKNNLRREFDTESLKRYNERLEKYNISDTQLNKDISVFEKNDHNHSRRTIDDITERLNRYLDDYDRENPDGLRFETPNIKMGSDYSLREIQEMRDVHSKNELSISELQEQETDLKINLAKVSAKIGPNGLGLFRGIKAEQLKQAGFSDKQINDFQKKLFMRPDKGDTKGKNFNDSLKRLGLSTTSINLYNYARRINDDLYTNQRFQEYLFKRVGSHEPRFNSET